MVDPHTFQCEACHGVFHKAWTDEECEAEKFEVFEAAIVAGYPEAVVCDACYRVLMRHHTR